MAVFRKDKSPRGLGLLGDFGRNWRFRAPVEEMANRKLEIKLLALGRRLLEPPSDVNELLLLLDEVENCLLRVSQSPSQPILAAVGLSRDALILKEILRHSDIDVKVAVSSCVSELTRITAPEAPYNDDLMKEIFQIIIASFENLSDTASRSYSKRLLILENMAKLRSCVMMLDLECDNLILEMFQHFLNTIRDYHADHVFTSMETIMTLVLEESEDISPELLSCLLASVEKVNQDVSPLAYKLGEKVITCCGDKLKPYLQREVQSKGINLMKYSEIIATVCQEVSDIVAYRDPSVSNSQLGQPQEKKKITGVNGETEIPGALSEFKGSLLSNQMEEQTPEVAYIHSEEPKATLNLEKKKRNDSTKTITLGDTNVDETVLCTNEISKKELSVNKENKTRLRIRTLDAEKGITGESSKKKLTAMDKNASKVSTRSGRQLEETLATKSKRRRGPAMDEASEIVLDEKFVGSRIKVWWPEDKKFYKGTVDAFDPFEKKHMIIYDDGEEEILLLKDEIWELVKDGNVSAGEQEPNNSNHHPSSEMPQKKKAKKTRVSSSKRAEVDTTSKRGEAASAKTFEGDGANIGGKVKGSDANKPGTKSKDSGRKTRTKSVGNIMASKTIDDTPQTGHKSTVGVLKIRSKPEIETTSKAESQAGSGILKIGGKSNSCGTSSSKGKSLSSLRVREESVKGKSPMKAYKKRVGLKREEQ